MKNRPPKRQRPSSSIMNFPRASIALIRVVGTSILLGVLDVNDDVAFSPGIRRIRNSEVRVLWRGDVGEGGKFKYFRI